MADNSQIAATLRTLAEAADGDVASHDLNTLADALDSIDTVTGDFPKVSQEAAKEYLEDHNTFAGTVIDAQNDVPGDLYVYEPDPRPEVVDTPTGWHAYADDGHAGINFDPV